MKIVLFFPPQADPTQPYSSLPALKAYLNLHNYREVIIKDLNIEMYDQWLLTPGYLERAIGCARERFRVLDESPVLSFDSLEEYGVLARAVISADYVIQFIREAKDILRDKIRFYDVKKYLWALRTINQALNLISAQYFPTRLKFYSLKMSYSIASSREVLQAVYDREQNLFIDFYESLVLPWLEKEKPGFIGISMTYPEQIIPGFTLARVIKELYPGIHICIGGAVLPELKEGITRDKVLYSLVDSFVLCEGEPALLALIKCLESGRPFNDVPNLVYFNGNEIIVNREFFLESLDSLPVPCCGDLPLRRYFAPEPVLLLGLSRGCHWGKCKFCVISQATGKTYRTRDMNRVMDDLQILTRELGARFFFLSDNSVSPGVLAGFAHALMQRNIHIAWQCETRLEPALTLDLCRRLYESGCKNLVFGFESAVDRLLELMEKGITRQNQEEILDHCSATGIGVNLQCFIGFPTETREEASQTVKFLSDNKEKITSISFGIFSLARESFIFESPRRYGMEKVQKDRDKNFSTRYDYELASGISKQEALRLKKEFDPLLEEAFPASYLGVGNDAHTLLFITRYGNRVFDEVFKAGELVQDGDEPDVSLFSRPMCASSIKTMKVKYSLVEIQEILEQNPGPGEKSPIANEDTFVLYNGETGKITCFKNSPHIIAILELLDGRHTVQAIAARIAARYGKDPGKTGKQCLEFIRYLVKIKAATKKIFLATEGTL